MGRLIGAATLPQQAAWLLGVLIQTRPTASCRCHPICCYTASSHDALLTRCHLFGLESNGMQPVSNGGRILKSGHDAFLGSAWLEGICQNG